jgi:hypothetical protein
LRRHGSGPGDGLLQKLLKGALLPLAEAGQR